MPAAAQCWAAIPAAGIGARLAAERPKQYLDLRGRSILEHSLQPFLDHPRIRGVVAALAPGDPWWKELPGTVRDRVTVVEGGDERVHSVLNCLRHLLSVADAGDWVLVHDAARPCLAQAHLDALIAELAADEVGGLLAVPVADTLKRADADARVIATEPRENLWQAQTPQMFRHGLLLRALEALGAGTPTDEARAIEHLGLKPKLVACDATNLKVTYPQDLKLAELILRQAKTV